MLSHRIRTLQRLALVVLLGLALATTGFAHRSPSLADQALELAVATGLTVQDICGDRTPGKGHVGPHCLACQITGATDLPGILGLAERLGLPGCGPIHSANENRMAARVLDPAHAPQGPPAA